MTPDRKRKRRAFFTIIGVLAALTALLAGVGLHAHRTATLAERGDQIDPGDAVTASESARLAHNPWRSTGDPLAGLAVPGLDIEELLRIDEDPDVASIDPGDAVELALLQVDPNSGAGNSDPGDVPDDQPNGNRYRPQGMGPVFALSGFGSGGGGSGSSSGGGFGFSGGGGSGSSSGGGDGASGGPMYGPQGGPFTDGPPGGGNDGQVPVSLAVAQVPEPGSLALLAIGLAGLGLGLVARHRGKA